MTEQSKAPRGLDRGEHWTHRLFVEKPELYLPFLEEAADRAPAETQALHGLFEQERVPANGRVLDVAADPIPGLYAAGELVGGLFYFNYPGGTGLTSGAVFGRLAGNAAAAYMEKK